MGTAAQGTVLTVLGRTNKDSGGWLQVKGATVTGWITSDPSLSVPGEFRAYTSSPQFSALYPATWTASPAPPASVVFRSNTGADVIIAIPAANVSQLPQGGNGYGRSTSVQIVVCGVTSHLVTYQRAASAATPPSTTAAQPAYLVQARLTLDAQHALGFYASLTDLGPSLQVLRAFLASVTFPSPRCTG